MSVRIKFGDHYLEEGETYVFGAEKDEPEKPDLLIATMVKYQGNQGTNQHMRHKITVLICLAVIAGLGLYAKQTHNQYQNKEAHAASVAQSVKLKAQAVAKQREAQFLAGVQLDEAQCARDQAVYRALAPAQRLKAQAPDCEAHLQQ